MYGVIKTFNLYISSYVGRANNIINIILFMKHVCCKLNTIDLNIDYNVGFARSFAPG